MSRRVLLRLGTVITALLLFAGCQTAFYGIMETFGVEKRDLLRKAVQVARDHQKETGKEFQDALTRLQTLYGGSGSDLEKTYTRLKADLGTCRAGTEDVRKRIRSMDEVAEDLFAEWQSEIGKFTNPTFAQDSRRKLEDTRSRYRQLSGSLKAAQSSMDPVLQSFEEHVLYLKHNLNASAIGSLKGEAGRIERQIQDLLKQMNGSIAEADSFIRTLG